MDVFSLEEFMSWNFSMFPQQHKYRQTPSARMLVVKTPRREVTLLKSVSPPVVV